MSYKNETLGGLFPPDRSVDSTMRPSRTEGQPEAGVMLETPLTTACLSKESGV